MAVNGLISEVKLKRPYMTDEEYWDIVDGLTNNALEDGITLRSMREYCDTHDEGKLTDRAEYVILHFFGIGI